MRPQPLQIDLGPAIASVGFEVSDHHAVIAELQGLIEGAPERAVAKRRAEFLAGRWAAREALAALGVEAAVGRNEDGSPRWPTGMIGSITHGADRALAAVARRADVRSLGIDSERLLKETASAELCARICFAEEQALLERSFGRPRNQAVTYAFSAKESLYKCLHPLVGRYMDFHAARVVEIVPELVGDGLRAELTLELASDWSAEFPKGRLFRAKLVASALHVESAVVLRS